MLVVATESMAAPIEATANSMLDPNEISEPRISKAKSSIAVSSKPSSTRAFGKVNPSGGPRDDMARVRLREASLSMSLPNEILPKGIPSTAGWYTGAKVNMGTEPYAHAIPEWWSPGIRFEEWRAMGSWFVIYPAVDAMPVSNTMIAIGGMEMWGLLASTGAWVPIQVGPHPAWKGNFKLGGGGKIGPADHLPGSDGSTHFRPGIDYMIHGGLGQVLVPWTDAEGADLSAVYLSVRHRLVLQDPAGPDDRALARFGVAVGVDYYPWLGAGLIDMEANYVPSAAVGQFEQANDSWRRATVLFTRSGMAEAALYLPAPPGFQY